MAVEQSSDTVKALQELTKDGKAGELIGIAYVAMYRGRDYYIGYTGECVRNTTWTRGMLADLFDALSNVKPDKD